jgi:type IX secretion system PorP/SprF family membrane protein
MKKLLLILIFGITLMDASAQDPQYSQFYAAPLYHNPAFTGSAQKGRIMANFRSQWAGTFITSTFAADNFIRKYNSGVGFIATIDRQGSAGLYTLYSSLNYAYEVSLSSEWVARGGLAFGLINRGFDRSKIILSDRLNLDGTLAPPSDAVAGLQTSPVLKFDISSGFVIYNKHFWIGAAAMHMTRPNLNLNNQIELSANDRTLDDARLPIFINLMTGFKIPLERRLYGSDYGNKYTEKTITPTIIYKQQGMLLNQLDFGAYVTIKPLVFGLYYRDIPFFSDALRGGYNRDALIFLLGYKQDYISAGYSFDLNVSQLAGSAGNTHELSFSYEFDNPKRKKRRGSPIPCPKF